MHGKLYRHESSDTLIGNHTTSTMWDFR